MDSNPAEKNYLGFAWEFNWFSHKKCTQLAKNPFETAEHKTRSTTMIYDDDWW